MLLFFGTAHCLSRGRDQVLLLQILDNLCNTLLHTVFMRLDHNLGLLRRLIRGRNTSKVLNLARPSLLVQSLGVTLLRHLNGDVNIDLHKRQRRVAALTTLLVQVTRDLAVGNVRRNETGEGNGAAVGKQLGDLGDAANVFVAVLFAKA